MIGRICATCGAPLPANRAECLRCARGTVATVIPAILAGAVATPTGVPAMVKTSSSGTAKRGKRRWGRALGLTVGTLVAAALAVIVFYAVRVERAFDTVNSVSTPAPAVSGAALGGSDQVEIDTGPAMTALAGGTFPTSTAELPAAPAPRASATSTAAAAAANGLATSAAAVPTRTGVNVVVTPEPSPTPTATPSPTATAPAPTATPTPSPTPTPSVVLSEIERVQNGDFESGIAPWYLEPGAAITSDDPHGGASALTVPSGGGYASQHLFFVPGTAYHAEFWAKVSDAAGEEGMIGVRFVDAGGAEIAGAPTPVSVASSRWKKYELDYTAPEGASYVDIYVWKPAGTVTLQVDDISVRSIVPASALDTTAFADDDATMTILLMGVDARPGEALDIGVRPDSLMVLRLNPETGSCRILSIPRDTRTELPGYGMTKINHALAVGGIAYEQQVVENLLGIGIDHYLLIDFAGFESLVDAVGGVEVDVTDTFTTTDGVTFTPGVQPFNGYQALVYARYRGGPDGDFGRIDRQQQVLRALLRKASGLNVVRSVNELLPAVEANLRTDLSPTDMAGIASEYRSRCTESTLTVLRLEGSPATYDDPLLQLPLYYIEVDQAEIRSKVAALTEP